MSIEDNLKVIKNAQLDIELLKRQNEKLCEGNDKDINNFVAVIKDAEEMLEINLKTSGEKKLECKIGYCSYGDMPDKWIYKDEVLMKFISSLPAKFSSLFYKVTTTIRKADLKKKLIDDNSLLFENNKLRENSNDVEIELFIVDELETCREVKGIEIESQEPKFNYKIK